MALVERLARNLERGGRQWTAARRKESLRRVLDSSRSDAPRLLHRLQMLMAAWENDQPSESGGHRHRGPAGWSRHAGRAARPARPAWLPLVAGCSTATVRAALPGDEPRAAELATQLAALVAAAGRRGPEPRRGWPNSRRLGQRARRLFAHRHELVEQLGALCRELTQGLTELAEDDSWARGQCEAVQARLAEGLSARSVRAASVLLAETRERQQRVRQERQAARDGLKQLIHAMLHEVSELGEQTGRLQTVTEQHAGAIESADTLEGLAGVVRPCSPTAVPCSRR